jgi:putative ABC transport system permease protein
VQLASYEAVREKLRGSGAIVLPYVRPMTVHLEGVTPRDVSLSGLSLSPSQAKVLSVPEVPWGGFDDQELATRYDRWGQILLPAHAEAKAGRLLRASTLAAGETLHFPLRDRGESFADYALAPAELLAALRTARQRKVRFDEAQKMFVMAHAGFRGFRLYARGIDDVAPLADAMQKEGIPVITQADAIERIRILDRGLTNVFWLVAVVGIVGGIAALIASLYASVERKKRDLGVMRLIGLTRTAVFQFPVYQGAGIAVMSMVAAAAAYFLLARIINLIFSGDLELGQEICSLPTGYLGVAAAWTLSFAVLSSLLAAWRATQIDPAEAVREE